MATNKTQTENDAIYYFNMNVPDWFANKPVQEKCEIVADLARELEKNDNPINEEEWDKLLPKD